MFIFFPSYFHEINPTFLSNKNRTLWTRFNWYLHCYRIFFFQPATLLKSQICGKCWSALTLAFFSKINVFWNNTKSVFMEKKHLQVTRTATNYSRFVFSISSGKSIIFQAFFQNFIIFIDFFSNIDCFISCNFK